MKFLIIAACVCVAAAAPGAYTPFKKAAGVASSPFVATANEAVTAVRSAPVSKDAEASVLRSISQVAQDGFQYDLETSNGIKQQASGSLEKGLDGVESLVVRGSYEWQAEDGTPVQVQYIADSTGYHPDSSVLPQAPEVPPAIQRSLEYIAAHPYKETQKY